MDTKLAIEAMERDLERYRNSVDIAERKRIELRMIDTASEATTDQTDHEDVMIMINLMNALYDVPQLSQV